MKAKSLAHQIITFFGYKVFQEMAKIRPVSLRGAYPNTYDIFIRKD